MIPKGIFTTGINIFDKAEQEKLQERARRFSLKPEEIRNFTDGDLEELHESLGITSENRNNVRFEAVHILGTNNLTTEDVLEYFIKYAPTAIEWVGEDSCNVTWLEDVSAARAMFYVSKVVRGMPAREACNPFAKEFIDDLEEPEEEGNGQSILLKNMNRIVELKVEKEEVPPKINLKNAVDISEITIPIPPGYWRLGEKHPKAKCLLLRFAFKTDKKPYKTESFNKHYKNLSGSKNLIPESKKKELRGIFDRNREINPEKNPWGSLAKNWNRDAKFCEREPELNEVEKPVEVKNPSIRVRLGTKKQNLNEEKPDNVEIREEEEEVEQTDRKKIKIPRMRMYADEEEEKIKRKKLLQTLKKQTEKLSKEDDLNRRDLRNVLGITNNKRTLVREEPQPTETVDLGTRLKNRTKNMVFTVKRDVIDVETFDRKENVHADIRSLIEQRRARSPVYTRRMSPYWSPERQSSEYSKYKRSNPLRRSRSPIRRRSRSPTHKRRYEGTLHSDKIENDRGHRHRHRLRNSRYSDDEPNSHKPKSKVAVVIKTQKKPAVASTIWSRVQTQSESESDSESESSSGSGSSKSEGSSSSEGSESETEGGDSSSSNSGVKRVTRPGFKDASRKLSETVDYRSPLKITMTNDHFKK